MKKKLILFLLVVMVWSMSGCGQKDADDDVNQSTESGDKEQEQENESGNTDELFVENLKKAPETNIELFEYEEVEGGIAIVDYSGEEEIVIIPEKVDGKAVIEIGARVFEGEQSLKRVKLADTVKVIRESAFNACLSLEVVVCGNDLQVIEAYGFNYCTSLKYVELNDNLEKLGLSSFAQTDSLQELYIPVSVHTLEYPFIMGQTNVTIYGEAGSAAEQYAIENEIPFEVR